jgi:hypothetical protein
MRYKTVKILLITMESHTHYIMNKSLIPQDLLEGNAFIHLSKIFQKRLTDLGDIGCKM